MASPHGASSRCRRQIANARSAVASACRNVPSRAPATTALAAAPTTVTGMAPGRSTTGEATANA